MNPLTPADARALVVRTLGEVAPDIEVGADDDDADLHVDFDLDSIDFLNLVVALHDATGVDIPERDYENLTTVGTMTAYLVSHTVAA